MSERTITILPGCNRCKYFEPWAEPPGRLKGRCGALEIYTRADSGASCHRFYPSQAAVDAALAEQAPAPIPPATADGTCPACGALISNCECVTRALAGVSAGKTAENTADEGQAAPPIQAEAEAPTVPPQVPVAPASLTTWPDGKPRRGAVKKRRKKGVRKPRKK